MEKYFSAQVERIYSGVGGSMCLDEGKRCKIDVCIRNNNNNSVSISGAILQQCEAMLSSIPG